MYWQNEGTLDLSFRGSHKAIEQLQGMFATAILKLPELPSDPKDGRVYDLNLRYAVITYLREALKAKVLTSEWSSAELTAVLTTQYERWWNTDIDHFNSKWQFLRYAGRYIRRPPIAQHRFEDVTDREVQFWRKDLKQKRQVLTRYSIEEFVATLAEHMPDHYRHAIRYLMYRKIKNSLQRDDSARPFNCSI